MPRMGIKKTLARKIIELVFPVLCVECGREGEWLCEVCLKTVELVRPEQCVLCRKAAEGGLCEACQQETGLDGVISIFYYHDPVVQKLVKALKYGKQADVAGFLADRFRRQLWRQLPDTELTATFVPLSRDRQAKRGFNQAEVLARRIVGDELPVTGLIKKVRFTEAQAKLNKKDRAKNLRGAFALTTKHIPEKIALFDDVITTGTTLSTIAKLLKKKGCQQVWAVTVAHD